MDGLRATVPHFHSPHSKFALIPANIALFLGTLVVKESEFSVIPSLAVPVGSGLCTQMFLNQYHG